MNTLDHALDPAPQALAGMRLPRATRLVLEMLDRLEGGALAVELPDGAGTLRVIAGAAADVKGPARTFSPINLWDARLKAGADVTLDLPEGHTAMVAVLSGHVTVDGTGISEAEIVRFSREGTQARLHADADALLLIMTGLPLNEPVVGHGPFVMTSEEEIRQAIADFNGGRFGQVPA